MKQAGYGEDTSGWIFRTCKNKSNPYVIMDKRFLSDTNLSWKAKGILAYLLSKPDDWIIRESDIVAHARDGRDAIRAGLRELVAHRYIWKRQRKGENGQWGSTECLIFEVPPASEEELVKRLSQVGIDAGTPLTENPSTGNPVTAEENPVTENPSTGNPPLLSNEYTNATPLPSGLASFNPVPIVGSLAEEVPSPLPLSSSSAFPVTNVKLMAGGWNEETEGSPAGEPSRHRQKNSARQEESPPSCQKQAIGFNPGPLGKEPLNQEDVVLPKRRAKAPAIPEQAIVDLFHERCRSLPQVQVWNDARKRALRSRVQEAPERMNPEWWKTFFSAIEQSDFLSGRVPGRSGGAPFMATFDWILRPSNFVKILEGQYKNRKSTPKRGSGNLSERERREMTPKEYADWVFGEDDFIDV